MTAEEQSRKRFRNRHTLNPGERPLVPDNRRCVATSQATGERCTAAAIKGGTVCMSHGGRLPSVRRAADARLAEEKAQKMLNKWEPDKVPLGDEIDVIDELMKMAQVMIAWRNFLGQRLEELKAEEFRYTGAAGEQLRSEVSLFERSMERVAKFLVDLGRLNLEERRVKVAEAQIVQLVDVIRKVLRDIELTPEQQKKASIALPKRLKELGSGKPPA